MDVLGIICPVAALQADPVIYINRVRFPYSIERHVFLHVIKRIPAFRLAVLFACPALECKAASHRILRTLNLIPVLHLYYNRGYSIGYVECNLVFYYVPLTIDGNILGNLGASCYRFFEVLVVVPPKKLGITILLIVSYDPGLIIEGLSYLVGILPGTNKGIPVIVAINVRAKDSPLSINSYIPVNRLRQIKQ